MKYKEKYRSGMIFRSKKHPWADLVVEFVFYTRLADTAYEFNAYSDIQWTRINKEEFYKHVSVAKGVDYHAILSGSVDIFPFPIYGMTTQKGMDAQIRKYELEYVCTAKGDIEIFSDDDTCYSDGV